MTIANAQCRLAARPVGLPKPTDWTFTEEPVPSPADGELLVRVEYLSIDPAMRTWMNSAGHRGNILSREYTEIGVAMAVNARGERYWTQVFARPQ